MKTGQQLAVVNVLGAVSPGVSRIALTEVVSDLILASSVLAGLRSTLVNIKLTGFPLQASLTLALIVVHKIVAVGSLALAGIVLTVINVNLTEFPLKAESTATLEALLLTLQTGSIVVTVNFLALRDTVKAELCFLKR